MRSIIILGAIVTLLIPAVSRAQTATTMPDQTAAVTTTSGSVDFGGRGTWVTGDDSRYQRYRDMSNGLLLNAFNVKHEQSNWLFDATGSNVGRRDQKFTGSIRKPGKVTFWAEWDQIPMFMSDGTRTLFREDFTTSPNVLTIPDAIQTQMQTAATAVKPGIFTADSISVITRSQRNTGSGGFEYIASPDLTFRTTVSSTRREGTLPYGGSFGQSSLVEMPAPIEHRLTDVDSNAEYTYKALLLRGGVTGSWFHNDNTQVTFDNPFQATDTASTPSRGQLSLPPSNSFIGANVMASVKMPYRSRATAYISMGSLTDAGAPIMAQTVNTVNQPLILALPRTTVMGDGRTTGANLTFTSRPVRYLDFSAHYRLYHYDNRTPEFVMPQRVSYDNAPTAATFSTLGGAVSPLTVESEPFGIKRQTFDVDARVKLDHFGSAGAGYSRQVEDRTLRFFDSTTENTARVSYDAVSMRSVSLRAKYEHTEKRGTVTDEALQDLFNIGEQPGMRTYDIASRNRDRVTVVGTYMPTSVLVFNASAAVGKDNYLESAFGLRDNTNRVYTGGVDIVQNEHVSYGLSYSYERYDALMNSRSVASPPSGANVLTYDQFVLMSSLPGATQSIADPRYDWANDGADRVHSAIANLAITKIHGKLDLRFSYDYNRARALYSYAVGADIPLRTLPEDIDPALTALPNPTALPLVRSKTQRGTFDALYALSARVGVGASFWYEDYRVSDFTLDADANPDLVRGSALLLGYLYRPYTARTAWCRVVVHW